MKKVSAIIILVSTMAEPTSAQLLSTIDNVLFVDVSKVGAPIGQYGMGFIGKSAQISSSGTKTPAANLMEPVIPRLIRTSSQGFGMDSRYWRTDYAWKSASITAKRPLIYQIVLSDSWLHKDPANDYRNYYTPGRDSAAMREWLGIVNDLLKYEIKDFITEMGADIGSGKLPPPKSKNLGEYFQLDIWNEPAEFFAGIDQRPEQDFYASATNKYYLDFLNVWVQTKRFIDDYIRSSAWCKNLGPNGEYFFSPSVVGPSFSGYSPLLRNFYLDSKGQSCKPDLLSWHELDDAGMRNVEDHITALNAIVAGDHTALCVNEWAQKGERNPYEPKQSNPAIMLRFLSVLERQGVLGSKACWSYAISPGETANPCIDASLNAFLTSPNSDSTRSAWWSFEHFNRLSGAQLAMTFLKKSENGKLDGIAAFDATKSEGWILVGNYDSDHKEPSMLFFKGISGNVAFRDKKMFVDHEIIENRGISAYPSPKSVYVNKGYSLGKSTFGLKPFVLDPGSIAYFHFLIR